jgi:acyltransferase-like protein
VLRAIAVTTVVLFHILAPTGHTFGEFGVDIFFVLSGFVIALMLDSSDLTVRRFIADRIARIVPLYWPLTFSVFASTLIAPSMFRMPRNRLCGGSELLPSINSFVALLSPCCGRQHARPTTSASLPRYEHQPGKLGRCENTSSRDRHSRSR